MKGARMSSLTAKSTIASSLVIILCLMLNPSAYAQSSINHYQLRLYAHSHLLTNSEMQCIDKLYERESHWNPKAMNPDSGAYGIPQGMSMWLRTATPYQQIMWGIKYSYNRYGSMCGAYRHWQKKGWH